MNAIELFDPLEGPQGGWPPGAAVERVYLQAFAAGGSQAMIANLRTRVLGLRSDDRIFPVTVNEAEYGDAYVCLPHTAYALYAKAELGIVDVGPGAPALSALADGVGGVLRAARINRIVHLNNWMLSTNLHGGWTGEDIAQIRTLLVQRFPDHVLAVRSLNPWSDETLARCLAADGWRLLPSRQIYVTDDLERDWAARHNTKMDLRLLARTTYRFDPLERLGPGDSQRIAELYAMLYLARYSRLNPDFTPAFIELTHKERIFVYRGLRDPSGALSAVVGCFVLGDVLTTPIVGYDTARPVQEGLYRMASVLFAHLAQERGLRLNSSAGAASFKRLRGARGVIERTAYYVDHLSWPRRAVVAGLESLLNRVAAPLMAEKGL